MSSILDKLETKMNLIYVISFFIIFVIILCIINGKGIGVAKLEQITNGVGILDMEPGYSVEKAYKILDGQGIEGRSYYLKRILPMDFIFPLTYLFFYCSLILYLLRLIHPRNELIHYITIVPLLRQPLTIWKI
jgi:hypothetical protein